MLVMRTHTLTLPKSLIPSSVSTTVSQLTLSTPLTWTAPRLLETSSLRFQFTLSGKAFERIHFSGEIQWPFNRIRVGRSIQGFGLSPGITKDQRIEVEKLMASAFKNFSGILLMNFDSHLTCVWNLNLILFRWSCWLLLSTYWHGWESPPTGLAKIFLSSLKFQSHQDIVQYSWSMTISSSCPVTQILR